MNFTDLEFLGLFLPTVVVGFLLFRGRDVARYRQYWLIAASFCFYAFSGLQNLAILAGGAALNFVVGRWLAAGQSESRRRGVVLWTAAMINLGVLGGFKLWPLILGFQSGFRLDGSLFLPLALSFITFQQIAFLVAAFRRTIRPELGDYLLFTSFFPHLLLGPILDYGSIRRQLGRGALAQVTHVDVSVGLAIFIFGLGKKLLLADTLGDPVNGIFQTAADGRPLALAQAWFGMIGFQLQLLLDFSAYSEMAIGLGRMFGLNLPINFDRPYHAINRFDLWRRWHITFVVFMRQHVFMPLVRRWKLAPWLALAVTTTLSGLWHGLGLTFLLWSTAQTLLLLTLHAWPRLRRQPVTRAGYLAAVGSTFLITSMLGTMFRSPDVGTALRMYGGLLNWRNPWSATLVITPLFLMAAAALFVWAMPDAQRFFAGYWTAVDPRGNPGGKTRGDDAGSGRLRFSPGLRWGMVFALVLVFAVLVKSGTSQFIYAQF